MKKLVTIHRLATGTSPGQSSAPNGIPAALFLSHKWSSSLQKKYTTDNELNNPVEPFSIAPFSPILYYPFKSLLTELLNSFPKPEYRFSGYERRKKWP
ncbi:hypothetical protein [Flavilitoribacter nigricans]|uniref:hypothetical protein n=1 Tax=Flavilitoribacter nigricans TaxID=70997 RepID=UPI001179B042|nr:hypothetical protein [Flavilitoribacter nigricans]